MKKLVVALMLSASAAVGLAGAGLAATGGQTPPASGQPNHPVGAAPWGMMGYSGGASGTAPWGMMGACLNMARFMTHSPMMGGSSGGTAGTQSPSH